MDNDRDMFYAPEQDDAAAADLAGERRERTLLALYSVAMCGMVSEEDIRVLCAETGVTWADLERYTPPILRTTNQPENQPTLDLPF